MPRPTVYVDFLEEECPIDSDGNIEFPLNWGRTHLGNPQPQQFTAEEIAHMRAEWLHKKAVENYDNGVDYMEISEDD